MSVHACNTCTRLYINAWQVWEAPVTEKPALEPLFTAGFHGIELAFLMMATFIEDGRG